MRLVDKRPRACWFYLVAGSLAVPWMWVIYGWPGKNVVAERPLESSPLSFVALVLAMLGAAEGLRVLLRGSRVRGWAHIAGAAAFLGLLIVAFAIAMIVTSSAWSLCRGEAPVLLSLGSALGLVTVAIFYVLGSWYSVLPLAIVSYIVIAWALPFRRVA